jgi:hypothetical protein
MGRRTHGISHYGIMSRDRGGFRRASDSVVSHHSLRPTIKLSPGSVKPAFINSPAASRSDQAAGQRQSGTVRAMVNEMVNNGVRAEYIRVGAEYA